MLFQLHLMAALLDYLDIFTVLSIYMYYYHEELQHIMELLNNSISLEQTGLWSTTSQFSWKSSKEG